MAQNESFDAIHPRFAGVTAFYEREIHGEMVEREAARREALRDAPGVLAKTVLPGALLLLLDAWLDDHDRQLANMLGFAGVVFIGAGVYSVYRRLKGLRETTKPMLTSKICRFLGLHYLAKTDPAHLQHFELLKLVPPFHFPTVEFEIRGEHRGVDFWSVDLKLERQVGKKERQTVFDGLLLACDFATPFQGRTVVTQNRAWPGVDFGNVGIALEPVEIADPDFARRFAVYGSDAEEARALLAPALRQRLVEAARHLHPEKLGLAFEAGQLLIALPRPPDRFGPYRLLDELDDPAIARYVLEDIVQIFRLIEFLELEPAMPDRAGGA